MPDGMWSAGKAAPMWSWPPAAQICSPADSTTRSYRLKPLSSSTQARFVGKTHKSSRVHYEHIYVPVKLAWERRPGFVSRLAEDRWSGKFTTVTNTSQPTSRNLRSCLQSTWGNMFNPRHKTGSDEQSRSWVQVHIGDVGFTALRGVTIFCHWHSSPGNLRELPLWNIYIRLASFLPRKRPHHPLWVVVIHRHAQGIRL